MRYRTARNLGWKRSRSFGPGAGGFSLASVSGLVLGLDPRFNVYTDGATALAFASSQYYNASAVPFASTGTYSASFWAKGAMVAGATLSTTADTGTWTLYPYGDNSVQIWFHDGSSFGYNNIATNSFTLANWNHFALTRSGSTIKCYVNGTANASGAAIGGVAPTITGLQVGRRLDNGIYANGTLANFRYWTRELSASDVAADYNSGNGVAYSQMTAGMKTNLVSSYDFRNSGAGLTADSHGSNTLTSNNGPTYAAGVALEPVQADGDPVSQWWDYRKLTSGDAYYKVSQATGSQRPLYKTNIQNGKPAIYFDGLTRWLSGTHSVVSQPATYFMVNKSLRVAGYSVFYDSSDPTNRFSCWSEGGNYINMANATYFSSTAGLSNVWRIIGNYINGASSSIYVNGSLDASGTVGSATSSSLRLGRFNNDTYDMQGYLGPIALYNANVSASDRTALFAYLNSLYGVY